MKRLRFIIIDGPMGSGKTTISALVHPKLKRTALVGLDRIKWFVSDYDRKQKDTDITRKVLLAMCEEYLKNGIDILLAQSFTRPATMTPFLRLAKRKRCRLHLYRLHAPRAVLLDRVARRPRAAEARSYLSKTRIHRNLRLHAKHQYEGATLIDTSRSSPPETAALILEDLRGRS